ncbi:MAG: hypothetical protein EXS25_02050 [Pedosphaera sp.]|nr:hypothetical protein [Pedosphaera sp.]
MKTLLLWLALVPLVLLDLRSQSISNQTYISSIRTFGTNVVVQVQLPTGAKRVTLESRSRFVAGTWTPRRVLMPKAGETQLSFSIPISEATEALRAVVDDESSLPLPSAFYSLQQIFGEQLSGSSPITTIAPSTKGPLALVSDSSSRTESTTRTVSESDIWKFSGSHLYFFNQYRGLHVFDVSNPAKPVLKGRLPLTSYGEQLHVLPATLPTDNWLALITQQDCQWDASEVLLVRSENGKPTLSSRLPVPGRVLETRLIGDILLLATQTWSNRTEMTAIPITVVTSIDLANPETPVVRYTGTFPFVPTAIHATDQLLFVATQPGWSWWFPSETASPKTHTVLVFDVSDPLGKINYTGSFPTSGRVDDKFKFGLDRDVLTVVSQVDSRWSQMGIPLAPSRVVLETFSIENPANPYRLATLNLVTNESVFATRFDAGRAYVVTFRRVDPLWIVDLSDPKKPTVRGELSVPGWSTYIEPFGDRLLAMGVELGRAAISLFDVADPAAPALLSKVFLGEGWSWSEANIDEKAFRVFPDSNLALLPWFGRLGTNDWFQGIQLLDFTRDSLQLRGTINHAASARRATLVDKHVLSISGAEILSADISNRDKPAVQAAIDLGRPVDRVLVAGDHLIQLTGGRWESASGQLSPLTVDLSLETDPETSIAKLKLSNASLIGADYRSNQLYLLQKFDDTYRTEQKISEKEVASWVKLPAILRNFTNSVITANPPLFLPETNFVVIVYEDWPAPILVTNTVSYTNFIGVNITGLTTLTVVTVGTNLVVAGSTSVSNSLEGWYGSWNIALWPSESTLLFTGTQGGGMILDFIRPRDGFVGGGRPWYGGDSGRLLAFDVSKVSTPKLASDLTLDTGSSRTLFLSGTRLFLGGVKSHYLPPVIKPDSTNGTKLPWWEQYGSWSSSYPLRVVDYADPTEPLARPELLLPGELSGISHHGNLLYARTNQWTSEASLSALTALAYDGVSVSFVDSRKFPKGSATPLLVRPDGRILIGDDNTLETWSLNRDGKLVTSGSIKVPNPISGFQTIGSTILAETGDILLRIETSQDPITLSGQSIRPCSLWFDASTANASPSGGLWIARSDYGLWYLAFHPL